MNFCAKCEKEKPEHEFYQNVKTGKCRPYCKACRAEISKKQTTLLREETINAYGGPSCINCGEDYFEVLTLDHVDGGGQQDRKSRGTGTAFYYSLKREGWPEGFQVLCLHCNFLKHNHPEKLKDYKQRVGVV